MSFGTTGNDQAVKISSLHLALDSAKSAFSLKIKQAPHIAKINPELNTQVYHLITTFNIPSFLVSDH